MNGKDQTLQRLTCHTFLMPWIVNLSIPNVLLYCIHIFFAMNVNVMHVYFILSFLAKANQLPKFEIN